MIKVENLVKRYGDLLALDHLNLKIEKGVQPPWPHSFL